MTVLDYPISPALFSFRAVSTTLRTSSIISIGLGEVESTLISPMQMNVARSSIDIPVAEETQDILIPGSYPWALIFRSRSFPL